MPRKKQNLESTLYEPSRKRGVTPEKAIEIYKKNGVEVTNSEAEEVLDIMYFLAGLVVSKNLLEEE